MKKRTRPTTISVRLRPGENPTGIQAGALVETQLADLAAKFGPKRSDIIAAAVAALHAALIGDPGQSPSPLDDLMARHDLSQSRVVELALFWLWMQNRPSGVSVELPAWPPGLSPDQPAIAHTELSVWFCPACGAYWFDGSPSVSWYAADADEDDDPFLGMASLPAGEEWHRVGCPAQGEDGELITIAEAAKLAGVSAQAMSQRVSRGTLQAHDDPFVAGRRGRRLVRRADIGAKL